VASDFVKIPTKKLMNFSFESANIRQLKFALSTNKSMSWWMTWSCLRWCWESCLFNGLWHHKSRWFHIRSRPIWISKTCTFHWYVNCRKYCWLQYMSLLQVGVDVRQS